MRGMIKGDSKNAVIATRPAILWRTRTKAAGILRSIASAAARMPTMKDLIAAPTHCGELKTFSYQASVKPRGGQSMKEEVENDIGMTKNAGAARKNSVAIPIIHRTRRDMGFRGRAGSIGRI